VLYFPRMRLPVTPSTFGRLALLTVGSVVFALVVPAPADPVARGIQPSIAFFAAGTVLVLLAEASTRRAALLESIRTELNKLRRVYHIAKNLAGEDPAFRAWFTDLHGYIYAYLGGFSGKTLDDYDSSNTAFRLISYHVYMVPELDSRKRETLFKDLLATTSAVSEARQQIKELWDNRLSASGWTAVLLMALGFIVSTMLAAADAQPSRIAAGTAIACMLVVVDLLWETDALEAEKKAVAKGYLDNMARLELGRKR